MNSEHFLEWFENQLCTHIPAGSLIVLDNASYHNTQTEKIPTKSSKKSDMQSWLSNHGIAHEDTDLKADLIAKITAAKPTKQFETDLIIYSQSLKAASGSPRAESYRVGMVCSQRLRRKTQ